MEVWEVAQRLEEGAESEESKTSRCDNDVGTEERESWQETLSGQFTWGNAGVITAILIQFVCGTWYLSHRDSEFDARIGSVERQEISTQVNIQSLNDARQKTEIHLTQVDDKLENMDGKISAILDIVQRLEQNAFGGGDQGTLPNFPHRKLNGG